MKSNYDLDVDFKFKEVRGPLRFIVAIATDSAIYLLSLKL